MNLRLQAGSALRRAVSPHVGKVVSPLLCDDIKREVLADLAGRGFNLWHAAHRIRVEFIDGCTPNLIIPPELLATH